LRDYFLTHSPVDFRFAQNSKDFVVDEVPLYQWTEEGEHLILKVRKRELTTWEMVKIIARVVRVNSRDIGYAGLKDRNGMTMQYISLPRKFENELENFDEKNIKILEKHYHKNKIKLGHLKGNRFFIRLKKVNPTSAVKISEALKKIEKFGMPNFFGYQRFGVNGDNYLIGKDIIDGKTYIRDRNKKRLFINSYQSYLFNQWLSERVKFSKIVDSFSQNELPMALKNLGLELKYPQLLKFQKHPFKLLEGDTLLHYPFGKGFILKVDEFQDGVMRFEDRGVVPSGILIGKRVKPTVGDSYLFEKKYLEDIKVVDGERRYAWVFPTEIEGRYRENDFWFELNFTLPKGSYATTLIEEIAKRDIN